MVDRGLVVEHRVPVDDRAVENDRASTNARELFDALTCRKTFVEFTAADGADQHCEQLNRSLANRVILDWLDDAFGSNA